jgi:hypothetical protein
MSHLDDVREARARLLAAAKDRHLSAELAHAVELLLLISDPDSGQIGVRTYAEINAARDRLLHQMSGGLEMISSMFNEGARHGIRMLAAELTERYRVPRPGASS